MAKAVVGSAPCEASMSFEYDKAERVLGRSQMGGGGYDR